MNKKIIASVLAVASVLTVSAGALADDNITVTVNGNNVSFVEITPFIENDHTLVPMREIFEALGADVQWDNETRTVISYDSVSDVSITMQIDSDVMYVNGDAVTLETPAKIVGSSTVVPVRATLRVCTALSVGTRQQRQLLLKRKSKQSRLHKFQTHGQIITVLTSLMRH